VLLPVRNGMPWLPAAIESIWAQSLRDLEIVALEDGSSDGTPAYLQRISDDRLRVIGTGGVGIARALNIGLAAARGRYIARQDADDVSVTERLACQVALLDAQPEIDVVATLAEYVDADDRLVENAWTRTVRSQQDVATAPEEIGRLMPLTCCVTHGSIVARADALRAARGYDADMVPAEDYDLWLRLLPSRRFVKIPQRLYRYRLHGAQTGARSSDAQTRQAIRAKLRYLRRVFPDLADPARLALIGETRGDAFYRMLAPEAGFVIVPWHEPWDVAAITNFAWLDEHRAIAPEATLVGNFLVRVAEADPVGVTR
jgi:glycosyltransferase involved in cell wall biosynthesis